MFFTHRCSWFTTYFLLTNNSVAVKCSLYIVSRSCIVLRELLMLMQLRLFDVDGQDTFELCRSV